jgi:hypothetical protein
VRPDPCGDGSIPGLADFAKRRGLRFAFWREVRLQHWYPVRVLAFPTNVAQRRRRISLRYLRIEERGLEACGLN